MAEPRPHRRTQQGAGTGPGTEIDDGPAGLQCESRDVIGADVYGDRSLAAVIPGRLCHPWKPRCTHVRCSACGNSVSRHSSSSTLRPPLWRGRAHLPDALAARPQHPEIAARAQHPGQWPPLLAMPTRDASGTPTCHYTARPPRVTTLLYALEVPMENGVALGATHVCQRRGGVCRACRRHGKPGWHRVAGGPPGGSLGAGHARGHRPAGTVRSRTQQPDVVHPVVTHASVHGPAMSLPSHEGRMCGSDRRRWRRTGALALVADTGFAWVRPQPQFRHVHAWQPHDASSCGIAVASSTWPRLTTEWPQHRRLMHRITVGICTVFNGSSLPDCGERRTISRVI